MIIDPKYKDLHNLKLRTQPNRNLECPCVGKNTTIHKFNKLRLKDRGPKYRDCCEKEDNVRRNETI